MSLAGTYSFVAGVVTAGYGRIMYDPRTDDLLDYVNVMRRRVDLLRDALSDTLAALPHGEEWADLADLYVVTDPSSDNRDDVEWISLHWEALHPEDQQMMALQE